MKPYFFNELAFCFSRNELWFYLAWLDIKLKYKRTKLGPWWMVLFSFISVVCLAMLGTLLFNVKFGNFFPYLATGMIIWIYISTIISDSCFIYMSQANMIKNTNIPLLNFSLRMFSKNTIVFGHSLILVLLIVLYYKIPITWNILLVLPAFLIFMVTGVSLSVVLGFLATRFRDIQQLVQSMLGLLAYMTPIMWQPEMLGGRAYLVNFNPLTHFVAIMRDPFLAKTPSLLNYGVSISVSIFLLFLASKLFTKYRKRIVHWL